jgi:hypothetical protein
MADLTAVIGSKKASAGDSSRGTEGTSGAGNARPPNSIKGRGNPSRYPYRKTRFLLAVAVIIAVVTVIGFNLFQIELHSHPVYVAGACLIVGFIFAIWQMPTFK